MLYRIAQQTVSKNGPRVAIDCILLRIMAIAPKHVDDGGDQRPRPRSCITLLSCELERLLFNFFAWEWVNACVDMCLVICIKSNNHTMPPHTAYMSRMIVQKMLVEYFMGSHFMIDTSECMREFYWIHFYDIYLMTHNAPESKTGLQRKNFEPWKQH